MATTFISRYRGWAGFCLFILMICSLLPAAATAQDALQGKAASAQPSYAALADILEDDRARQALIDDLRQEASERGQAEGEFVDGQTPARAGAAAVDVEPSPSLARQVAEYTQAFAEQFGAKVSAAIATLSFESDGGAAAPFDRDAFISGLVSLTLVAGATIALYLLLRAAAAPLFARAGSWVRAREGSRVSLGRRVIAISASLMLDVLVILLACATGYATALYGFGEAGAIGTRESLFINAFAMIETFKAVIRMLFAARYPGLRPFPVSAEVAQWWSTRLRWLSGTIGYSLLVIVPIVNVQLSRNVGALISLIIMATALTYAVRVILANRRLLTTRLQERAQNASMFFFSVLLRILSRTWHVLAITYFLVLFVVSQLEPDQALPYMMGASAQTLLAIGVGLFLSALMTMIISRHLSVPEKYRLSMPRLEDRVNAFVPVTLKTLRVVLLLGVGMVVLNAWAVFDLADWLASDTGAAALAMLVRVGIILLTAMLFWTVAASFIEARMNAGTATARKATLLTLFQHALAIVICTITFMVALSQIGVDIAPLIAGAGVLGLAIGFGAQKMVQDVITGVFIQVENALNVGDIVTVAGISGTAERLSMRSVAIRDLSGTFHVIPFSSVDTVSNYMRDFAFHVGEYGISYREDIDHAVVHLREAFAELKEDETHGANILDDINVAGVTALADSSVNIRVMIKTQPGTQWGVGRAYNRLVKIHFDRAGIEIPFPHSTLYFGEDRQGRAPAANIALVDSGESDEKRGYSSPDPAGRGRSNPRKDWDFDDAEGAQ